MYLQKLKSFMSWHFAEDFLQDQQISQEIIKLGLEQKYILFQSVNFLLILSQKLQVQ